MAKMSVALAGGGVIHDHEFAFYAMLYSCVKHDDLIPRRSLVTFYDDFE